MDDSRACADRCVLCAPGRERLVRCGAVTCDRCHDRLAASLETLTATYGRITTTPRAGGLDGGRRAPGFFSCPPLDLHSAAMRDPRTVPGPGSNLHSPTNFAITWARWVREQRNQAPAALPADVDATFAMEMQYLAVSLDWITRQLWVVTFAKQLRATESQTLGATGVRRPRPFGNCTAGVPLPEGEIGPERPCGHPLFPPRAGIPTVTCRACTAEYSPLQALLMLSDESEPAAA